MANTSKRKGDKGELEGVAVLVTRVPHLCVPNPMRALGAGRRDDHGDLRVLPDVSIQVKTWAAVTRACRESVEGAVRQARNAANPMALGLVPIPNTPKAPGALRWLAVAYDWPGGTASWVPVPTFGVTLNAVRHLRTGFGGKVPLRLRMVQVKGGSGRRAMFIGPLDAWLECYAEVRGQQLEPPLGFSPPWEKDAVAQLEAAIA